ncbi:hypothetical protein [Kitasatospora sp. NPDC098663]|uniref:hypothetical protein n=1 Tax=Kitasatospora sp. NPDC098663 TaxID=3364096 RepID=UPI0038208062
MRARNKLFLATAAVAATGAVFAGVAVAADPTDTTTAPYAQAAVSVDASGNATHRAGPVESVTKDGTGRYCITLKSTVDVARSVPVATLDNGANWNSEIYVSRGGGSCPANSVRVTTATNGGVKDQPFNLLVP